MKKMLLNNAFILKLIIINALLVFIQSFDGLNDLTRNILMGLDIFITVLFTFEIYIKIKIDSFKVFFQNNWNRFDFILVGLSAISLLSSLLLISMDDLSFLLVLRVARIFKAFRFLKFIPNIDEMLRGIRRAMKASILVLFALIVYNFILAVLSCHLFKEIAPDYFGNPLQSLYSIFRIFTVEGWYEIPDIISANTSPIINVISTLYFIGILVTGGILGLSLVNSIFVDAMVADNNDALEAKVDKLTQTIEELKNQLANNNPARD